MSFNLPLKANILIVDDTPDNLRLLAKMLESQNYVVRKSLNGKMALQAAHRDPPELILLDINMPDMNGYEVCQQLKASEMTCHIPIIFISALDQVQDKIQAFELGGQDYITKPFQELEVLARIKNQLVIQHQQQKLVEQQHLLTQQNQKLAEEIGEREKAEAEVRLLNTDLEHRVQLRTLEVEKALNFEATLKRITDQVRDSLDQHQILHMAVQALAEVLQVQCCDAALYNPDRLTSTIRYQWVQAGLEVTQGQTLYMADLPEVYEQLQQRMSFAFCQIQLTSIRNHSAIFACPIFDNQVEERGILGDLWLFKATDLAFSEMEIHLVQQVSNQCAIALRQARLYEAAQAQVQELRRLNQLKDDFLSTISHELRSPIANMKMVMQLLEKLMEDEQNPDQNRLQNSQIYEKSNYLAILQEECDRELKLVEDLLNLQHLEAGTYPQELTIINLQDWVFHIIEPFELRLEKQQQNLQIDLEKNLPSVRIDPLSLSRIITELLNNACKYTPIGGNINFAVSVFQDPEISYPENPPYKNNLYCLRISVQNTGVQIPTEELSRVFDKFYRIPNNDPWKYGGTGLGLALVKKLIEQMNGTIQAESQDNSIKFTVKLPLTL